jgi:hypothetical protein
MEASKYNPDVRIYFGRGFENLLHACVRTSIHNDETLSLLAAVFGEFVIRRFEIAGDLLAVSGNLVVTLLLYDIFKPVIRGLSLVAASFNLVGLTCGALRWNPQGDSL